MPMDVSVRNAMLAAGFIAVYVLLDWMAHYYASGPQADTPWNPAQGVGLAWLLLYGNSWLPVLFLATLAAELLLRGEVVPLTQSILISALMTAGYAGLAGMLRSGPLAIDVHMQRMRDMILFTISTACATLVIATLYMLLQSDLTVLWDPWVARSLIRVWIGELIGVLVFGPLVILIWSGRLRLSTQRSNAFAHGFGIFLAALFAFWAVYGNVPTEQITSLYLLFLPLIWASLRFGLSGSVVIVLILQIGVILLSHLGSQSEATVLQFQIRLLAIAVTGLYLGVAVDQLLSTEQKLRERQAELDRTLRLAASAELASAMAHELNQPLSAIRLYTRSCELLLQSQRIAEMKETMVKIGIEVQRAGDVVHKLRDFYRSGGAQTEIIGVAALLSHAVETLRERAARHDTAIVFRPGPALPSVLVDRVQIETVLHNLLANAIEAIRDANCEVRRIILSATVGEDMIEVSVQDSGPGLTTSDAEQVFRPFYSSKSYGLGLGLSMSRSIIEAHGGTFEVMPSPVGCCFRFRLPIADSAASMDEQGYV